MKGKCKLYDIETDLRESHIFPKFVIDYTKKTGSKYLRNFVQPNRRHQDGPKLCLFSHKAEQEFGKREKWFAENIFIPYLEQKKSQFEYNENLYYFAISLLWRSLIMNIDEPLIINEPYRIELLKAQEEWKSFLKEYKFPIEYRNCYIFLTDRIDSTNTNLKGADFYLTRTLDATIISNPKNTYIAVYLKFSRFIFWSVIRGENESNLLPHKIDPLSGKIIFPQTLDEDLYDFLINRITQIEGLPKASKNQQEQILKDIHKDMDGFLKSDLGQSIINDIIIR